MKKYLALARVSSEEQQREGFSLDIQEEALREWAAKTGAEIAKMYRVAETAHKSEKRKVFHEMLASAREQAGKIAGILFYKLDRAARNMQDWIELVSLRDNFGLEVICITEPFDQSPAGKLNANMLAAISQFYSDQLAVRTKEGVDRRVKSGLFPGHAPYGYENYRENGRGLVRVNKEKALVVQKVFNLYATGNHTLDSIVTILREKGFRYSASQPYFMRSLIYDILRNRSYL